MESSTPDPTPQQTDMARPLEIEVPILEEEETVTQEEVIQPQPTATTMPVETPTLTPTPQPEEEVIEEEDTTEESEVTEDETDTDTQIDPIPEDTDVEDVQGESSTSDDDESQQPDPVVEEEEEKPVHVVSIPGNWASLSLNQQLMLNPYQCTPNNNGVILFSSTDATCLAGSPSALTGNIIPELGDDIPVDDTSEAPEEEEVVEKPPPPPPPEEESDSSADIMPTPENGRCPNGWFRVQGTDVDYCFLVVEFTSYNDICPEGFTWTDWDMCQDVDRFIDCSDDTVMDAQLLCYDPAIWGECPDDLALDFLGYCQGYSHDGECPAGWALDPWNYCRDQDPARNDYCENDDLALDPWGNCYQPEFLEDS
ncbi:hypothetical protein [Candidatus Poriferisocius sp.]|uniref:hypothetical protein n=1 Tax=Candidatus Poriferisocius sp. TaxID=3101276 RepID=UPI003B52954C